MKQKQKQKKMRKRRKRRKGNKGIEEKGTVGRKTGMGSEKERENDGVRE